MSTLFENLSPPSVTSLCDKVLSTMLLNGLFLHLKKDSYRSSSSADFPERLCQQKIQAQYDFLQGLIQQSLGQWSLKHSAPNDVILGME